MKGIFELHKHPSDSSKDKVKWCFAMPGQPRPVDFSAKPGSNHKLLELERFVLDEEASKKKLNAANAKVHVNHPEKWIEYVDLKDADAPDAPLEEIRKLRKLDTIRVDAANSEIVKSLSGHPTLTAVFFACEVEPEVLQELSEALPHLTRVGFHCPEFTPELGRAVARFKSLSSISITNNQSNLQGVDELTGRYIALSFFDSKLNQQDLDLVASTFTNLKALEFVSCDVSNSDLEAIANLKKVRLVFRNCKISEQGTRNLKSLSSVDYLTIDEKDTKSLR